MQTSDLIESHYNLPSELKMSISGQWFIRELQVHVSAFFTVDGATVGYDVTPCLVFCLWFLRSCVTCRLARALTSGHCPGWSNSTLSRMRGMCGVVLLPAVPPTPLRQGMFTKPHYPHTSPVRECFLSLRPGIALPSRLAPSRWCDSHTALLFPGFYLFTLC